MEKEMPRILIETMVRQGIQNIKEDPERGTRNIIDLAVRFSNGRFQKHFLELIQNMLKNRDSAYYPLVYDVVTNVDSEQLLTMGINVGYNSCTLGAQKIREWEKEKQCNVPWTISLEIGHESFQRCPHRYKSLVSEGEQLGIFTWIFFVEGNLKEILSLAEEYPDSAFILFCNASYITKKIWNRITQADNVMLFVEYADNAEELCLKLREEKRLYGVFYRYGKKDVVRLKSGEIFEKILKLNPAVTVVIAENGLNDETQKRVHELILKAREEQKYKTILWEFQGDICLIDEVISDDCCMVSFIKNGDLQGYNKKAFVKEQILFYQSLQQILMNNYGK